MLKIQGLIGFYATSSVRENGKIFPGGFYRVKRVRESADTRSRVDGSGKYIRSLPYHGLNAVIQVP